MSRIAIACLAAVFAITSSLRAQDAQKPIRALLVAGGGYHDYKKQQEILKKGIESRAPIELTVAYDKDTTNGHLNAVYEKADWYKGFDVVLHDECTVDVKDLDVIAKILEPHAHGMPGVVLHCGMHSFRSKGWPKLTPWFEFTGLYTTGHGAQLPIAVDYIDKESPITKGLANWSTGNEELYNNVGDKLLETAHPLARGKQVSKSKDGKERVDDYVCVLTNLYKGKAKVFATTLGHNNATVADGRYLDLVTRGILWSVGRNPAMVKETK
jgi:type 1 glutamine amidotransferase